MSHPAIVDRTGPRRLSDDLSQARIRRLSIQRVYDTSEPSTVTYAPLELDPFELRFSFWRVEDDELPADHPMRTKWLALPPQTIPPDDLADWTEDHASTLYRNRYAYRRFAQEFLDGRPERAFADRGEVFSLDDETFARTREDALPDIYLIALERAVQDRLEDGYTLVRIAADLKVGSYETLNRRRKEAKRRNLGPTS